MRSPETAMELCIGWLRKEEAYQFGKYGPPDPVSFSRRTYAITQEEVPNRWHQYRLFRDQDAPAQASQAIMKACAAARAGVILDGIRLGAKYEIASAATIQNLREICPTLPPRYDALRMSLELPFDAAMERMSYDERTLPEGYMRLGALAVVHIMENALIYGKLSLPEAGQSSGNIR